MLNQLQHKRCMPVDTRAQEWYVKLSTNGCDKHRSIVLTPNGDNNKHKRPDIIHT
jgi:O-methyltransferase involved in polyketide biosynthesis